MKLEVGSVDLGVIKFDKYSENISRTYSDLLGFVGLNILSNFNVLWPLNETNFLLSSNPSEYDPTEVSALKLISKGKSTSI